MNVATTEVDRDTFFEAICAMTIDVHPRIEGPYPYTSIFETKNHIEVGRIVGEWEFPEYVGGLTKSRYFLLDEFIRPEAKAESEAIPKQQSLF
ncbi:hypothetical protein [Schlesneria sp. T3-172]|uniref:hypothetical protein n=1 Tax=Schlesneria sphaerica TaxID=3373610 RepID=UPI0037C5A5EC